MAKVVIVNRKDEIVGAVEKLEAVENGYIRRISHVILTDGKGKILLQRRSSSKKSNPLRWTFSAAGHVDEGETYKQSALRELEEELGVRGVALTRLGKFYNETVYDGTRLFKFNTVFLGTYSGKTAINKEEVDSVVWKTYEEIVLSFKDNPQEFTEGFFETIDRFGKKIEELSG